MSVIHVENLSREFRVLNRREGLVGTLRDLFSTDFSIVEAVKDISLTVEEGEIVGYIGPNGAGKSTTIKMMTGILQPSSGEIRVNGNVPHKNRQRNAQNIGVIFGQRTQLWWDLPVIESFKLLKEIYRIDPATYDHQIELFNDLVDLQPLYARPVRNLSLGQRMLCDIVAAFLHNPKVVFLDEPTIGLDISVKSKIRHFIRELNEANNTTIILTSHDISDIEVLCQRTVIIDKGAIIFDGPTSRVNRMFGAYRTLRVQIVGAANNGQTGVEEKLREELGAEIELAVTRTDAGWVEITFNEEQAPLLTVLNLCMSQFPVKDVQIVEIGMASVIERIYEGALA